VVVVVLMKIFMFAKESIATEAKKRMAEGLLSDFVNRNSVLIASTITADKENIGKCEVAEILIKAPMEVGSHSFQEAEIEVGKTNIFRKIYPALMKLLKKIDYKDIPYRNTICGLVVIITFRIIVSR
jgi:hypothetical protein